MVPPKPVNPAMVAFASTVYVAPIDSVTAVLEERLPVTFSVPAVILVPPVYAFEELSVNTPDPTLFKDSFPLVPSRITPEND